MSSAAAANGTSSSRPLGRTARSAVVWNAAFNVFRDGLQFAVMLVLVRLVSPSAYGQFGFVNAVIACLSVLSFKSFVAYTLQVRADDDVHYQEQFTAGAFIQCAMIGVANVVALCLRFTDTYSNVAVLVHLMSIIFVLDWPCELCKHMLQREMDWRRLRTLHAIGLVAGSLLAVGMGMLGAGVYALLFPGLLVTLPFIVELFVIRGWRPRWSWSRVRFAPALRFGLARAGSGAIMSGRQLLAQGAVAEVLGFAVLGVLNRAVGLGTMFCSRIATQLLLSLYPVLTKIDPGTDRYRRVSSLLLRLVTWIAVPIAVLFSTLAEPIVFVLYGEQWRSVVPLLPWTMALAAVGSLTGVSYQLLLAHQRHNLCLLADTCGVVGVILAVFLILPSGFAAYLATLIGVELLVLALTLGCLAWDRAICWSGVAHAVAPAITAATLAFAGCEVVWRVAELDRFSVWSAVGYGSAFMLVYVSAIRVLFLPRLQEILEYVPGRHTANRILLIPRLP